MGSVLVLKRSRTSAPWRQGELSVLQKLNQKAKRPLARRCGQQHPGPPEVAGGNRPGIQSSQVLQNDLWE